LDKIQVTTIFQLVKKSKSLKIAIKKWRRNSFESPEVKIHKLRKRLKEVHDNLGTDPSNAQYQREELLLQDEIGKWLSYEEDQWKQNSRETLMHLGDKDAKNFYSVVKIRQARNHLSHLITEKGEAVTNLTNIKELAHVFYEKLFNHFP